MMNANLPLFSLKFKSYGWKGNEFPYVFLTLSAVLLFLFNLAGTPMIIVLYVIMSLIQNKLVGDKSVENKKPGN